MAVAIKLPPGLIEITSLNPSWRQRARDASLFALQAVRLLWVGGRAGLEYFSAARPNDVRVPEAVAIELRTAYRTGSEAAL